MKKYLSLLIALAVSLYAESGCTEEQIARMIKENVSQETISSLCEKDEMVIRDTGVTSSSVQPHDTSINRSEQEYFLWRIGVGQTSIEDFSETAVNFGLQYYFNGVGNNGFGIGYAFSATVEDDEELNQYGQTLKPDVVLSTQELEFLYEHNFGYMLGTVALTMGKAAVIFNYTDMDPAYTPEDYDSSIKGLGIYLTHPSIVSSGYGASVFFKYLEF